MYAVFQNGSKQYLVSNNQIIRLEKINVLPGKVIEFDQLIVISNESEIQIGSPFIKGGKIKAEVISHGRKDKIKVIKFRRRKHFRKHQGHRQWFTDIKITSINVL